MSFLRKAAAAAVIATVFVLPVRAQEWPSKSIKLVVPFTPAGGTDIIARVLGAHLSETLKQPIVVENKPGAGGNIGVDTVAKSQPDGYTIVLGQTSNLAINRALYPKLPYDPLKDLAPVALVVDAPVVLVVGADSKIRTFADLVAAAKANPNDVTFGSPGNGTVSHLTGVLVQKAASISLSHVPYRGAAPALTDLMGGRLDTFMASVPTALPQIKGGRLRAIVVTSAKRSPMLPDVPTLNEVGLPDVVSTTWFGVLAPAGTPRPIIDKLNAAINVALKSPEVAEKLSGEGGSVLGGSPDKFATYLKSEVAAWAVVVKESGAKID